MFTSLSALLRGAFATALLASGLAVLVARLEPQPARYRLRGAPRYSAINGSFIDISHRATEVLDTETGRLIPLRLPEGEQLQWASFSEWVDEQGESQVVGCWVSREGKPPRASCNGLGLGRFAFPSGRALDRIRMEKPPASAPCWYPGTAARVLFAASDGRLYHYAFEHQSGEDSPPTDSEAQPIAWPGQPARWPGAFIEDPTWPKDPRLGGRFLASVSFLVEDGGRKRVSASRIWWFRLGEDDLTIVDAGQVSADDGGEGAEFNERFPRLTETPDGGLALAFHLRPHFHNLGELCLARLELDPRTGAPTFRASDVRRLGADCIGIPPSFAPGGNAVFTLVHSGDGPSILRRLAFAESLPPPSRATLARRQATTRSVSYQVSLPATGRPG